MGVTILNPFYLPMAVYWFWICFYSVLEDPKRNWNCMMQCGDNTAALGPGMSTSSDLANPFKSSNGSSFSAVTPRICSLYKWCILGQSFAWRHPFFGPTETSICPFKISFHSCLGTSATCWQQELLLLAQLNSSRILTIDPVVTARFASSPNGEQRRWKNISNIWNGYVPDSFQNLPVQDDDEWWRIL